MRKFIITLALLAIATMSADAIAQDSTGGAQASNNKYTPERGAISVEELSQKIASTILELNKNGRILEGFSDFTVTDGKITVHGIDDKGNAAEIDLVITITGELYPDIMPSSTEDSLLNQGIIADSVQIQQASVAATGIPRKHRACSPRHSGYWNARTDFHKFGRRGYIEWCRYHPTRKEARRNIVLFGPNGDPTKYSWQFRCSNNAHKNQIWKNTKKVICN